MYIQSPFELNKTMAKRNHTILCWLLAVSLAWFPFAASADLSTYSIDTEPCHEMSLPHSEQGSDKNSMNDPSSNQSMAKKACCDNCYRNCSCAGISGCNTRTSQASPFIIIDQYFTQHFELTQSTIEQLVQYHSLTPVPDIRPPIV